MRARDNQRAKVYRAEQAVMETISHKRFPSIKACGKYIQRLSRTKWMLKHHPNYYAAFVRVKDGRGRRSAVSYHAGLGHIFIGLPIWGRRDLIILHEVAHSLNDKDHAGHGREFCHIFLTLVRRFMGREAYRVLRASFKDHRVRYTQPRRIK